MLSHIARPGGEILMQPKGVMGKESPRGFLKTRKITGQRYHEMIGTLLRFPGFVFFAALAPGFLHQFSQSH